jgi:hypothetical protein
VDERGQRQGFGTRRGASEMATAPLRAAQQTGTHAIACSDVSVEGVRAGFGFTMEARSAAFSFETLRMSSLGSYPIHQQRHPAISHEIFRLPAKSTDLPQGSLCDLSQDKLELLVGAFQLHKSEGRSADGPPLAHSLIATSWRPRRGASRVSADPQQRRQRG